MSNANDAALKNAQIKLRRAECARSMGQRLHINDAAVMDALVLLKREEYAGGTEQSSNDAVPRDVQTELRKEECTHQIV